MYVFRWLFKNKTKKPKTKHWQFLRYFYHTLKVNNLIVEKKNVKMLLDF